MCNLLNYLLTVLFSICLDESCCLGILCKNKPSAYWWTHFFYSTFVSNVISSYSKKIPKPSNVLWTHCYHSTAFIGFVKEINRSKEFNWLFKCTKRIGKSAPEGFETRCIELATFLWSVFACCSLCRSRTSYLPCISAANFEVWSFV